MKKFTKIAMAVILTLAVCTTIIPAEKVGAKNKNIYFSEEYRKKIVITKGGKYNGTYKLKKRYIS